jgi:pyruvate/2-oxoglutarate dehydrogenase complex dihydrolipoamide dehydrogenase (E3) component
MNSPTLRPARAGQTASTEPLRLEPWDAHNRRLLANVHPAGWTNPEPRGRYDLVVIGAGTGGLVTAAIAAGLGARVALVERHLMGGDCLNVGCVPSKAVIRAARAWRSAHDAAERFGGPAVDGDGDFAAVMERMRRLRADISAHDGAERFAGLGVEVFLGEGRFVARDTVQVAGASLQFRRAVIATGGRPAAPPVPGLAEAGFLTNETVFGLTERPRHLVVIGAGPIGCELAQAFARFGSRVTLLDQASRVLPRDDRAASRAVLQALESDGVEFVGDAALVAVERREAGGGAECAVRFTHAGEERTVVGDRLLVAAGRAPNVEALDLDTAGVRFGRQGIEVDDRLRTANPRVYAVGDVASHLQFTHAADAQARLVIRNALFFGRGRASDLVIPWCTYTSPEVAHVGIDPEDAARREDVETITVTMEEVDRARLDGDTAGFLHVHLERGTDTILGATMVAEHAGELISQVTQAMVTGTGLEALSGIVFPYPTRAEILRRAADNWRRRKLTARARRAFGWFFRLTR